MFLFPFELILNVHRFMLRWLVDLLSNQSGIKYIIELPRNSLTQTAADQFHAWYDTTLWMDQISLVYTMEIFRTIPCICVLCSLAGKNSFCLFLRRPTAILYNFSVRLFYLGRADRWCNVMVETVSHINLTLNMCNYSPLNSWFGQYIRIILIIQ